jgi:ParB-like nuclease domain
MSEFVPLSQLVYDEQIYPRQDVNEQHVRTLQQAIEGGHDLPPIVVDKASNRIIDGVHRWQATTRLGRDQILVEFRSYNSEAELFKDAVLLNSASKLPLDSYDKLKVIEIGTSLGLKELDLSAVLRTSVQHLRSLKPRFATVEEAQDGVQALRRVALKAPVRHLRDKQITASQAAAIRGGYVPGQSYLLTVRQLITALELDLLPPASEHPTLWSELRRLKHLIR